MFERGKKDGPEAGQIGDAGTQSGAGSSRSAYAPGAKDSAVIGRSIRIDGDLQGEEDLRIEGTVTGTVKLPNNALTIGREGQIRADVYARSITVDGLMEGDLYGAERVAIRKSAQVKGNITAPSVSLEEGARFKGSIEMDSEAVEAALGKSRPARKPTAVAPTGDKKEESAA